MSDSNKMSNLRTMYHTFMNENADPRVKDWLFMSGPIPIIFILVFYLYLVKIKVPDYMKNRPAYDLKTIINTYNAFQIVANIIIFWGLLTSGWTTTITMGCVMPDFSDNPESVRMAQWMHTCAMLKIIELIETIFFVLRKKNNQASFLHIYHHVITVTVLWMAVKFVPGGMASLTPLINSFVHIIMYSYYLTASIAGPSLRKKLNKWKMWLTIIQMMQFTILLFHSLQALKPSCPAPLFMVYVYLPNLLIVYYLFWDFFKNTYRKKSKSK